MTPRVMFRADASKEIGFGHVARCLSLTDGLLASGVSVGWITNACSSPLKDKFSKRDISMFEVDGLSLDPTPTERSIDAKNTSQILGSWNAQGLILDHYGTDLEWEQAQNLPLFVIDDLPERIHDCEVLLDQNLPDLLRNYSFPQGRTPITLIGPHYALLRDEFRTSPLAQPASIADKVLVSVGGTDPHFATAWVLNTLAKANPNLTVVVTFSKNSDHLAALKTLIDATPISVELHLDAPNMSELMLETRFTIGAAGSSCWERCALGVPSILFSVAPNQDRLVETISAQGGALAIQMFDTEALEVATQKLLYHDDSLLTMAAAAQVICDGKGVSRTVPAILNMLKPI